MDTIRFVRDHFNMTILLIEHDMKLVGGICEELTVLNFGQVLCQGETAKVLKDPAVVTAYLGRIRRKKKWQVGSKRFTRILWCNPGIKRNLL